MVRGSTPKSEGSMVPFRVEAYIFILNFCLFLVAHSLAKPIQMKSSMTFMQSNGCKEIDFIFKTRGPKGHISCTWVQCATFLADWPGRPSCFPIGPKNTNLVEDVEILLPVKFRWIPFSSFRGEVENVSANQRPGRPSCFSNGPKKHKLGRGHWDLASCQVSLNSVQWFQRRRRKCLSQSEARAAILFFQSAYKTQTW